MVMGIRERNKQEVVNAAVSIAQRNNWNPQDLVAIVSYETGGTFNPWQAGPSTTQTRGLFQWVPENQERYGITRNMSIADQMEAGAKYLADRGVKPGDGLLPMYAAVNAGHASLVSRTDERNGGRPGTVAEKVLGKEFKGHIERAAQLVEKYVNPSTMNGYTAAQQDIIDGVTRVSNPNAVGTPSPRPDPNAPLAAPVSPVTRGTLPDITSAPGGLFDYSRAAADMTGEFPSYEAEKNLSRSLAGITPSVTSAQGGLLSPAGLAGQYGQYQPASGNAWNDQPTVNERMASPRTPTMEQQRLADAVRNSVAPQVASAPGGLFQPTGAFNNVNQTRPSGSFSPSSPFGVAGLPAASGPALSGAQKWDQMRQENNVTPKPTEGVQQWGQMRNEAYPETPRSYPAQPAPAKPSAPVSSVPPAVSTAYQNYAASRMAAPSTPAPASRSTGIDVANSAMSLADQYASYGAGKVAPMQTASSATQAAPEAPRTVAPRQVTPYSPPAPVQPAMTPERAKALGMVATPNVPGKYMPDVKANPAQVMKDQLGLFARNPQSLFTAALGALQGGVFFDRLLPDLAVAKGGLLSPERQQIGGGLTAPGGNTGGNVGGIGGLGGFQAGGGNWGNYGSSGGFNSGFTSSSGFTYDR
jgi:hypothetical protein